MQLDKDCKIRLQHHIVCFLQLYGDFFENVMLYTNGAALITAVFCMAAIYAVQRWINPKFKQKFKMPLPAELIAVRIHVYSYNDVFIFVV